jgi:O-antigen ligase
LNWALFGLAALSLLATRSATSVSIFALAVSIILGWVLSKRYGQMFQLACIAVLMVITTATFSYFVFQGELPFERIYTTGLDSMGKDSTLTGRTALWKMMGHEIARHPWFGIGYGSFWLGLEGQSITIVRFFSWQPGQAHSGYIDVINELGYVGLTLLIAVLFSHLANLWCLYRADEQLTAVFHFAILAAALALNISESSLMRTTHIWWIIMTISIVEVHALRVAHLGTARNPNVRPEAARA